MSIFFAKRDGVTDRVHHSFCHPRVRKCMEVRVQNNSSVFNAPCTLCLQFVRCLHACFVSQELKVINPRLGWRKLVPDLSGAELLQTRR